MGSGADAVSPRATSVGRGVDAGSRWGTCIWSGADAFSPWATSTRSAASVFSPAGLATGSEADGVSPWATSTTREPGAVSLRARRTWSKTKSCCPRLAMLLIVGRRSRRATAGIALIHRCVTAAWASSAHALLESPPYDARAHRTSLRQIPPLDPRNNGQSRRPYPRGRFDRSGARFEFAELLA